MAAAGSTHRITWFRTGLVGVLLLVLVVGVAPGASRAEPVVPFAARFSADDNGTVTVFGNNLLTCPDSDARCAATQAGTLNLNNNAFVMTYLDADDDPSTSNSSSVEVTTPPGGEVLWAGLYWGARTSRGAGGAAATGDRRTMSFRPPGGAYTRVTSEVSFGPTADGSYQEFAEVTARVRAAGPGTYWGADVVAGTGEDRYAGWSLVVVARAPGLPLRNLTVFDGFADVGRGDPQAIALSGFRTPVSGPVETQLGMVAYEGDYSTSGDTARLNDTQLSTAPLSRGSNFFNGTNDTDGVSVPTRTPAHVNMLGYDVKNLAASGIPNGATSATVTLESTGDRYLPGVVTTAIRLFAPDFTTSTKTVANLAGRTPAYPGDTLEYTLTYPNTGQDPATAAVLTDRLPPGTTFVSAEPSGGTCTGSGRDVTCQVGTIPVDGTWRARVRVLVGPSAGGTTLMNAAVLAYTAQTLGRDLTYVVAPATIAVDAVADLALTKTLAPTPGVAGGQVTSTLTVTNAGPDAAARTTLTDRLPAGTTFVGATAAQGSCTHAAQVVTCDLGSVAVGAPVVVTVVVAVPSGSTAESLVNTASVTAATADLDPSDNSAGGSVPLVRAADLVVTKTADAATVVPGGTTTFAVTARNAGPSDAVDVVLTDALAGQGAGLTAASAPGATCTVTGDAARCSVPVLAPGAALVMTLTARVSPDTAAGEVLRDTASATSRTPDPDPANSSATASVTTSAPRADVVTTKSSSAAVAGGQVTYTVGVVNDGPSSAAGVQLVDPLPAGVVPVSVVSSRGTCVVAPTVTCDLGDLPGPDASGRTSSATVSIVAQVAPDVPAGSVRNTAVASTTTTDPVPGNDAGSADTTVTASADVSVTKTAAPVQPAAGQDVTFTVTVANAGPSTARSVVLDDALPPGLTLMAVDAPPGVRCTSVAALTCDVGDLAPGGSAVVDVTMAVPADADLQTGFANTASVTSPTPDPAPGNGTATATITSRAISDVAVLVWDTTPLPPAPGTPPRTFIAGETVTYDVAALNFGPSDAATARVVDTLPPGVTFVSSVPECTFTPPDQVVCDLPPMPAQFAAVFPVTVRVDPDLADGTELTHAARISLLDPTRVDPVSSNDFAAVTNPVATAADLGVVKQTYSLQLPGFGLLQPSAAPAGTPSGYLIDVRNAGPSVARDVVLVDSSSLTDFVVTQVRLVRPGVDPVDLTADCSSGGGDLQCPLGDLPPFAAGDPAWRVQVDGVTLSNAAAGSYTNTATVTSSTTEVSAGDNTAQAPITVTAPVATLTLDKTVLDGTDVDGDGDPDLVPGTAFGYLLSIANVLDLQREGAADADGVVVTDTLPAGLTPTAVSTTQGTCTITPPRTVTCQLGTVLGPGRVPEPPPVLVTVSGTVDAEAAGTGSLTNSATVTSPISAPASGEVTQDVVAVADLALVKVPDATEIAAGSVAGFSLVVTNAGPSDALGTEVGDLFPPEIVFEPAGSDPGCAVVTLPEGTYVSCPIGTLRAGESRTVRVSGQVSPSQAPTSVVNVAAVASPVTGEFDLDNNRAEVPLTLTRSADLVVTKAADASSQAVGQQVTYTVAVTDAGPSDATDVVLVDPVPSGLRVVAATGDGLDCVTAPTAVTCTAATLAAGVTGTATIVLELSAGLEPGPVVNTATVTASSPDPDATNDVAGVTVDAFVLADTVVHKSVLTAAPSAGAPVSFAIDVENRGPQQAPRVVVSDSLAAGTRLVSTAGGACSVSRPEDIDVVTCELGALAVGATTRVVVTVLPDAGVGSILNGALVGSSALDQASADNYDDVEVVLAADPDQPAPPSDPPTPGPSPTPAPGAEPPVAGAIATTGLDVLPWSLLGVVLVGGGWLLVRLRAGGRVGGRR